MQNSIVGQEHRTLPRWDIRQRVRVQLEGGEKMEAETRDLSCSGVGLRISHELFPGESLKMKIFQDEASAFEVDGHVGWNRGGSSGRYAGIHFDFASETMQDMIRAYALDESAQDMTHRWFSNWS